MGDGRSQKICAICHEDCSDRPRTKDRKGHYYCTACYQTATQRQQQNHEEQQVIGIPLEPDALAPSPQFPEMPAAAATCPSCGRTLAHDTKICIDCGINIESGRSIVTSRGVDPVAIWGRTEPVLKLVSVLFPFGFHPLASEAMGVRRPYATWVIAVITVIISVWFWLSTDSQMDTRKNLMLWSGNGSPTPEFILGAYSMTKWGDADAMWARLAELESEYEGDFYDERQFMQLVEEVHASLEPKQQVVGSYHGFQLLTHALLHSDIFHLAGNLLFLLIIGARVNALLGNVITLILYPLFAVVAAVFELIASAGEAPLPMVGASGAIMGLAGAYLILFPVNRLYMSAWLRILFFFRMKIWRMRGFWVLLAFIAFDLLYVSIGLETGVAHWAHLGGFICGMVAALVLLLSRFLNAGGADMLTVVLGRRAWLLIGRPDRNERLGLRIPGVSP